MSSIENGGVYAIRHIESRKVYVGSAVNFHQRWRQHRRELSLGLHHNNHLQNAWNKYGPEAFVFEVLQAVEDDEALLWVEQQHIERLKSWRSDLGYNICRIAGSCRGVKRSQETRGRLRNAWQVRMVTPGMMAQTRAKMRAASRERRNRLGIARPTKAKATPKVLTARIARRMEQIEEIIRDGMQYMDHGTVLDCIHELEEFDRRGLGPPPGAFWYTIDELREMELDVLDESALESA